MDQKHYEIIKSGVKKWNAWREDNPDITPNLSGRDLNWRNLIEFNLSDVNLSNADLRHAYLTNANLRMANLSGTNLKRANLIRADLTGADMAGADLRHANLSETNLSNTNLHGVSMGGADLHGAKGIIWIGFDPRGFVLVCWLKNGEPWFNAGICMTLSEREALAHWGNPNHHNKQLGAIYVKMVTAFSEIVKTGR